MKYLALIAVLLVACGGNVPQDLDAGAVTYNVPVSYWYAGTGERLTDVDDTCRCPEGLEPTMWACQNCTDDGCTEALTVGDECTKFFQTCHSIYDMTGISLQRPLTITFTYTCE